MNLIVDCVIIIYLFLRSVIPPALYMTISFLSIIYTPYLLAKGILWILPIEGFFHLTGFMQHWVLGFIFFTFLLVVGVFIWDALQTGYDKIRYRGVDQFEEDLNIYLKETNDEITSNK